MRGWRRPVTLGRRAGTPLLDGEPRVGETTKTTKATATRPVPSAVQTDVVVANCTSGNDRNSFPGATDV